MTDLEKLMSLIVSAPPPMVRAGLELFEGKEGSEKPQKWLSSNEAMKYAGGIGRSCLWSWRTQHNLKSFKVNGKRLFSATAIDAFIIEQAQKGVK